jgi:hypothetical protein
MASTGGNPSLLRGRSCGTCSLCCKLIGIHELKKPMNQWCPHCLKRGGCSIYEARPAECRTFNCEWLINANIGDEWQPTRAKMVLHYVRDGDVSKLIVHVDPGSPLTWRNEPYITQLRGWARKLLQQNGMINIYVGDKVIVVLPDKEVALGAFKPGDRIIFRKKRAGSDWEYEFEKISADLPAENAPVRLATPTRQ